MADDNGKKNGKKSTYDLVALRRNYAASDEEWLPDFD